MRGRIGLLLLAPLVAAAQSSPNVQQLIERLDRLEEQNRKLVDEIRELREELVAVRAGAPVAGSSETSDRVAVQERRTEELSQAKVESSQKQPLTLTGMLLFNAFLNGRYNGGTGYAPTASLTPSTSTGGATLRQTVLGLKFRGPELPGGGQVSGSLYMDFFAGTGTPLNQLMRIRVATLDLGWKRTTISFGQDKPLVAPREPETLAQVGVSPLTGAGNLWLWQPQVRLEQRFAMGEKAGLNAQVELIQTSESGTGVPADYQDSLARARPGFETRLGFWAEHGAARFEVAPSFHGSSTHVLGQSVASRIYSVDWMLRPLAAIDFTGAYFTGENVDVLGGLREGVVIRPGDIPRAVHAQGGWGQFTWRIAPRLTFHTFGGQQNAHHVDAIVGGIEKNQGFAANLMYRLSANVLSSIEFAQVRTTYVGGVTRLNPHYDLALAYLF